ncbi:Hypothetical predicted protein [Mytilus galloprovincialis]|uniref:PH domain-containing protein n=1 Tax=Mytilus galloprovincialis TaxID=29158 RepID=A0A8B6E4A2_MYTGA|nr:Hypothetical predicted protein [Mytilus galloprovincialis]
MKMVIGMQKSKYSEQSSVRQTMKGLDVKTGSLQMVQSCNGHIVKLPVLVQVYKNCFEHYAVICRDAKYTSSAVYLSLKNSKVYKSDHDNNEIMLVHNDIDGSSLTLQVSSNKDVNDWISVLQSESPLMTGSESPSVRRASFMPALHESLQEESDSGEEEDER